jgi:hypothetical protein
MKPELVKKHLEEVKSLESKYQRILNLMIEMHDEQRDITSRIQILLNKLS